MNIPRSLGVIADSIRPVLLVGFSKLTVIESGAFAGIRNVVIDVPDSVKRIERGAFDQSVTLYCSKNSAAEKYCNENGLKCILK